MANKFNKQILKQYLLGLLKDESLMDEIEEKTALDNNFAEELEIIENELFEQFTNHELSGKEIQNFENLFLNSKNRRKKLVFTKALKEYALETNKNDDKSENTNFWKWLDITPKLAFGVTMPLILFAIVGIWIYTTQSGNSNNYIAKIEALNENSRPVEARIVDFKYLPHRSLRGEVSESDSTNERRSRILETTLLEAVENRKTSKSFNDLGVFYLTLKEFDKAISQFEQALRIAENYTQARSNLSVAYFEKSNVINELDEKLKLRAMAFDQTMKAIKQGDERLELLFNKALMLQAMNIPRQAIEAWKEYLEKDKNSKWANEARNNLRELQKIKIHSFKDKEEVFNDFIEAFQAGDEEQVWKIHSHSKEVNAQRFLPLQLARSYLRSDEKRETKKASLYLKALRNIGDLEKEKNADVFFVDLAGFYSKVKVQQKDTLLEAHKYLEIGLNDLSGARHRDGVLNLKKSQKLFLSVGSIWEAGLLEVPLGFGLTRIFKFEASNNVIEGVIDFARNRNYKWLLSTALDWKTSIVAIENEFSRSIVIGKESLQIAEETENIYQIQRMSEFLAELHAEMGETRIALKYLAKGSAIKDKYNENVRQAWRNHKGMSKFLGKIGFHESAIAFGNEYIFIANMVKVDRALLKLSYYHLTSAYIQKGDYRNAEKHLILADAIVLSSKQSYVEKKLNSDSYLMGAEIKRKAGNCTGAVEDYKKASEIISEASKYLYQNFVARKGLLYCYLEENKNDLLKKELENVLNMYERNRRFLNEEKTRNSYFHEEQTIYDIGIDYSLNNGDELNAFRYSEASKARSLLDFIKNGATIKKGDLNYNNVAKPLSLKQIQQRMPKETQLIQYAILPNKIVTWIINNDSFEVVERKHSQDTLKIQISEYLKLIKEKKNDIEAIKIKSNELYELLIAPILSKIDTKKHLFIVGDKFLHRLPFASLFSSKKNKYFIENFTISNAPSATIFILKSESAESKVDEENLLSIGNPTFNQSVNPHLNTLKFAKNEAVEISQIYEKKMLFVESEATKSKFIENFANFEIVHFAGHYVANQNYPLNSKLLMAKSNSQDASDLRVAEIAETINNNLKLVILSACQTDVEQFYNGEGAIGAARVFLGIGSPIVVASHFEVDSESTSNLMINFHGFRKNEGLSVAKALQKAQIKALNEINSTTKSPFYWSAFSPTGGYTTY